MTHTEREIKSKGALSECVCVCAVNHAAIQEAIDFFKSEIKGDDLPRRVEDVHKVKWIAGTIGPHKTVNDIIPFLHGM